MTAIKNLFTLLVIFGGITGMAAVSLVVGLCIHRLHCKPAMHYHLWCSPFT